MSSTISCNKAVTAFRTEQGNVIYALFEQTYESNVTPQTPGWSCISIGEYDDVLRVIFDMASATEGGMLKVRHGRTRPEPYLDAWFRALRSPLEQRDQSVFLKLTQLDWEYNKEQADKLLGALQAQGLTQAREAICNGETVQLSLHQDWQTVLAIFGVDGSLPAYKALQPAAFEWLAPRAELAPATRNATVPKWELTVYALDEDAWLVRQPGRDDEIRATWALVSQFVEHIAIKHERAQTGAGKKAIRRLRTMLENAPAVSDKATVTVTSFVPELGRFAHLYADDANRWARDLGLVGEDEPAPEQFTVSLGQLRQYKILRTTVFLPKGKQLTWHLDALHEASSSQAA